MLSIAIYYNYQVDFENTVLKGYEGQSIHILYCFLYYFLPYSISVLAYSFFYKKTAILKNFRFWAWTVFSMACLSFDEHFYLLKPFLNQEFPREIHNLVGKISWDFVSSAGLLTPGIIYWSLTDRKKMPLYGFSAASIDLRPYYLMLLFMLPLITWASFQNDFLENYPTYMPGSAETHLGVSPWISISTYEFFYLLSFVAIEFFFRGFLILGFKKYLGQGCILPMATLYCLYHFGKPLPEAVSSFFGGALLGIIAYYTRSIYGGILIHMGIAFLMEMTAIIQHASGHSDTPFLK